MNQLYLFLGLGVALFVWLTGKVRFDLVALALLFVLVLLGIIPVGEAFTGFSHPAVITLVSILIMGQVLQESGVLNWGVNQLSGLGSHPFTFILLLSLVTAISSAFISGMVALIVIMPVAIQLSHRRGIPVSRILLPISFASLLGAMTTLIGNPANIFISTYSVGRGFGGFGIFDFLPAGGIVALLSIVCLSALAVILLPKRGKRVSQDEDIAIEDYITEVKVLRESLLAGSTLRKVMQNMGYDVTVIGLVREKLFLEVIDPDEVLLPDDILVIEADSESLKAFMDYTRAKLIGGRKFQKDMAGSRNISMREVVVLQDSTLIGKTAAQINLRSRFGINLLAISRAGRKTIRRVGKSVFRTGDVLLIQGRTQILDEVITAMGCMPLSGQREQSPQVLKLVYGLSLFITAIVLACLQILPVHIAFAMAALLMTFSRLSSPRQLYQNLDWALIVLMGALIPIANALHNTGAAQSVADTIYHYSCGMPLWCNLGLLMLLTMVIANLFNGLISAMLLVPVALQMAYSHFSTPDVFLMAISLGAASSFVIPRSNPVHTITMGPGAYRWIDYLKLGLPMQLIVIVFGVPALIWFWG